MKRVLITGAAGFLGSHLCDRFIKEGYFVMGMDNLITGDLRNIEHLFKNENFEFYNHDVSKFVHVSGELDYILHFASPASPIDYLKIPIQTLKVGALGTHNALGVAKAKGAKFLLASTSEVYGDPLVNPQPETYWGNVNCVGPRGCYDESKRFAEAITIAYHKIHKVDTKIARIFNTFGPHMRNLCVLVCFFWRAQSIPLGCISFLRGWCVLFLSVSGRFGSSPFTTFRCCRRCCRRHCSRYCSCRLC